MKENENSKEIPFEEALREELLGNIKKMLPECSISFLSYLQGFIFNGKDTWK